MFFYCNITCKRDRIVNFAQNYSTTAMKEWTIERYTPGHADEWNYFVASARNSTFLFNRAYMDYHADRFKDHSMIARKGGRPVALLPANITPDGVLHSHQGLTYGGWVLGQRHSDCVSVLEFWEEWLDVCRQSGITAIDYKPLPHIYATQPSDEDIYALFRHGATISECNCSSSIRLANQTGLNENRRRLIKKALACPHEIMEINTAGGMAEFHAVLTECLAQRHDATPVHSLAELELLKSRFPQNIRAFGAYSDDQLQAGVVL